MSDGEGGGGGAGEDAGCYPLCHNSKRFSYSNLRVAVVSTKVENNHFDQVSLENHDNYEKGSNGSGTLPNSGDARHSSDGQNFLASSPATTGEVEHIVDYVSTSFELYAEPGYSPFDTAAKNKQKATMPSVSPELLHLIDSTIMGKSGSLEKLRNIVGGKETFGDEGDNISVAFLVVDSLLATMGGVECFEDDGDTNTPRVMLNSRAAIVSGQLIPWLPCDGDTYDVMSPRTRMVRGLLAILQACTRNRALCSAAGLLNVLLTSAECISIHDVNSKEHMDWDGTPLLYCIQHLAGHSLSVIDLHRLLQVITRTMNTVWAPRLMHALEEAIGGKESKGPACTFEFVAENSGLLGPGDNYWPFSNGYAFATWIFVESFADTLDTAATAASIAAAAEAATGKESPRCAAAAASARAVEGTARMPHLFGFFSGDNQGMEAYFNAQYLVVEIGNGKGKKASLHFTYAFKPQCWYFIGLEHIYKQGLIGKVESELRLYIDGSLYESRPFEFTRISKPLAFCCIGTNPPTTTQPESRHLQCHLFAEMGAIYIFKEPIGPEKMSRLASRGSDVLPSFGSGAGLPWSATADYVRSMAEESSMLDAEIAGCIHLLYHPKLFGGRFCPDASPSGAAGLCRRPAKVIGQVHIATRMQLVETLWAYAYGGPMSILPLVVSNMKKDNLEPEQGNLSLSGTTTAIAAPLFRVIAVAIQHPRNSEELSRRRGPEILSKILNYILQTLSSLDASSNNMIDDEELVAAVISVCQAQERNHALKVQLFSTLLLDLKIWSVCSYALQKKLLSSLAGMVSSEISVLQAANAIQMLLDGCRRCYWIIREKDCVNTFSLNSERRHIGEVNALIDQVLIVIEHLLLAAPPSSAEDDMSFLLGFMVDCPQPNQVSRLLNLIYRLVTQPKEPRSKTFAEAFLSCGGIEALLVLLQHEAKAGDICEPDSVVGNDDELTVHGSQHRVHTGEESCEVNNGFLKRKNNSAEGEVSESDPHTWQSFADASSMPSERMTAASGHSFLQNTGGISFNNNAKTAINNVCEGRNDEIAVGIIRLLSYLVVAGHLKLGSEAPVDVTSNIFVSGMHDTRSSMFDDKVSLLFFALQKAFEAAPKRLLSSRVYIALLGASIDGVTDNGLHLYDSSHRFEHLEFLLVLLRSLPYAPRAQQSRVLQDLLFLACSHSENRRCLTQMQEWPEWILEVLISNHERDTNKGSGSTTMEDIEDLVHNFLFIMLENCMQQKDGWKEIEATIHCAEWLCIVGGSSAGNRHTRPEESLPRFKRRLLGTLLDFLARELQVQTHVIAVAAAGVAADSPSFKNAKADAESVALLSVALIENAIVILMLVEDHLRLQSKSCCSSAAIGATDPSLEFVSPVRTSTENENALISSPIMERQADTSAAEPYESVSSAFVSYGSCALDMAEGWKYRSQLWYGVGVPSEGVMLGGGGSGWKSWNSALERDDNGNWIELPLIKKSVLMLQALLLSESGLGAGGGSGGQMGGTDALCQLLDSDQPFLCILRLVLLSMREEDNGDDNTLISNLNCDDLTPEVPHKEALNIGSKDTYAKTSLSCSRSALLWRVISPVLNMPISESKRQRVLVTSCVLYSEIWHAIGKDREPLRKNYLNAVVPAFVAILRRWRPLLTGIHDLATPDSPNPLVVDDQALGADAPPMQAAFCMISPGWAAAFASPPAAMALAMIAAGTTGGEPPRRAVTGHLKREYSLLERKRTRLQTFSSFQKPLGLPNKSSSVRDKAAAKAAALSAARDLERISKVGSGRGLIAVAMATSAQRRNTSDTERAQRWHISEAMGAAWMECLHPVDTKSVYGKDLDALSYKFIAVLVASFALARNIQRSEIDRRNQVALISKHHLSTGSRAWKKLIRYLLETNCLFGPSAHHLCNPEHVFWRLNFMESSSRMRRCLRRNYRGSMQFNTAAHFINHVEKRHNQEDIINMCIPEANSTDAIREDDEHSTSHKLDSKDFEGDPPEGQSKLSTEPPLQLSESRNSDIASSENMAEVSSMVAPGYVPSELDERIILELPTLMVKALKVVRGTFQITSRRINFIADSTEENLAGDQLDSISKIRDQGKNYCWMISALCQIYSRRYLLRKSALEIFMLDGSNFFFDFGSNEDREDAYKAIIQARPPRLNNIYLVTQRPHQLFKRTQLMERWARREISNFEYLMELNTLAGRSYNDITQYPVFPWILSDYKSKDLDLSNPDSYRELSKPVGALNPQRLMKFQEKYTCHDHPFVPKFHYGSHYSSIRTVLYYLIRLEPFTSLFAQLQGGNFVDKDGIFSDIAATWRGVLDDTSDVKELVPELFYLPETLSRGNSVDFQKIESHINLDAVKLPNWAKDPVDFVHKHRMALESEHVSAHLHEWIDLIFGYKQRGKEAIAANNVFLHGSYDGAIDVDKITDAAQRRAIQHHFAYSGQTPSQLLTVPHMKRMTLTDLHLQNIFRNPSELKLFMAPKPERCNLPASAIHASSDVIVIVNVHAPAAHVAVHNWQPNNMDGGDGHFLFQHGKPMESSSGGAFMRMFKGPTASGDDEWQYPQALAFAISGIRSSAVVSITGFKEIITGGHADNSIKLISTDGAKTLETAIGHCAPVTCLSLSSDSSYLVSGSQDTTVILWRIHKGVTNMQSINILQSSSNPGTPRANNRDALAAILADKSMKRRIEGPIHILQGHLTGILCCCVNSDLGIIASCSSSSDILLHTVRRGRFIRRLAGFTAHEICVSPDGIVMAWNQPLQTLSTFTLNGLPVARAELRFPCNIGCMEVSSDGQTTLVGFNTCSEDDLPLDSSRDWRYENNHTEYNMKVNDTQEKRRLDVPLPSVCFLDIYTLEVRHALKLQQGQNVTALALNKENTHLLVSTEDKQLMIFTHPSKS